jgi:hypothetical protein
MRLFVDISLLYCLVGNVAAFHVATTPQFVSRARLQATVVPTDTGTDAVESALKEVVLEQWSGAAAGAKEYAEMFGLAQAEAGFYGLFDAMRKAGIAYCLKGYPFVLRKDEISQAIGEDDNCFEGFFTMKDLAQALDDDFLDAARGSMDNRKGWKVRDGTE